MRAYTWGGMGREGFRARQKLDEMSRVESSRVEPGRSGVVAVLQGVMASCHARFR